MKRSWLVLFALVMVVGLVARRVVDVPRSPGEDSTKAVLDHAQILEVLEGRSGEVRILDASVVHVIDGDTVVVASDGAEQKVRYVGVDTPERDRPQHDVATRFNSALVRGQRVRLAVDRRRERDKAGRLLAAVFLVSDGEPSVRLVNDELVRSGLAYTYFKGRNVVQETLHAGLVASQRTALDGQQGLWAEPTNRLGVDAQNGPVSATKYRFHRSECGHIAERKTKSMQRSAALRSGRSPCRTCAP